MADEGQRGGELPASAAAVAVGDDAPVGLELQSPQQVGHHLGKEEGEDVGVREGGGGFGKEMFRVSVNQHQKSGIHQL